MKKIVCGMCLLVLLVVGCKKTTTTSFSKPLVVCTTNLIGDMIRQIAGDEVQVLDLMKPGVDPHTYNPKPEDLMYFRRASLVFVNGLHLEGKMLDMIDNAGKKAVKLAEQKGIVIRKGSAGADPHVWWDASFFSKMASKASVSLIRLLPDKRKKLEKRTLNFLKKLSQLHRETQLLMKEIPLSKRLLVTSHDAFYYFGQAYGLEVDAVLGISSDAQARAIVPLKLAKLIHKKKITAIFHETSVSQAQNALVDSIQRLAWMKYRHKVKIAGPLFSDSLGERGSKTGSYLGAFRANVRMIYESLSGKKAPLSFYKKES